MNVSITCAVPKRVKARADQKKIPEIIMAKYFQLQ